MAFWTRSAVRALTLSEPLMVRETVAVETLASLATSLMFIEGQRYADGRLGGQSGARAGASYREARKYGSRRGHALIKGRLSNSQSTAYGRAQTRRCCS